LRFIKIIWSTYIDIGIVLQKKEFCDIMVTWKKLMENKSPKLSNRE